MSGRTVNRKLLRRGAAVAAVALVLGTATLLAVTGTREPAAALKLLTGRVWLANSGVGSASQVDGYSGKVGAQAGVGNPGDPFRVVQRPDGAYVLDLKTGKLTRLSDATLTAAASRQVPGDPSALQVLAGPAGTWVLDQSSGVLQQVDDKSLAPDGPSVPLGASTGTAVLDADGTPWVPVPSKGTVVEVTASGLRANPVGSPGDLLSLQVTATGVWAVDGQAGRAQPLSAPGPAVQLPQVPAGITPVAGSSATSPYLPVVVGDQLLDVDTGRPAVSSTSSPDYVHAQQVALVGNTAYLLAPGADQVDAVTLSPLTQQPPIPVPPGADQLVSKDGLLFVNSADSPQAVVVGPGGSVTPVSKYTPTQAPPAPGADATAPLAELPLPAPTHGGTTTAAGAPVGPAASGAGTGGPAATGSAGPLVPPGSLLPPAVPVPPSPAPTAPPSPQAPGPPTLNPVSASGPTLSASWSPPASTGSTAIASYKLTVVPQGSGATPAPVTVSGQTTSAQVSGLTANTTYCAQVQAVNGAGAGPLSNQQCAQTSTDVPGAPGQPQVTLGSASGGGQQANVSWSPPTDLGPFHTPVTGYDVTLNPSSGASSTVTSATTTTTVTLALGVTYTVTVKAVNANGHTSADSPASRPVATDGPPGKAGGVTAQAFDQEIDVSWTAASANNNQNVNYKVSVGGTTKTAGSPTTLQFTGLTADRAYTVTVTATDAAGDGPGVSTTATPWGRSTIYYCQSDAQWGNYPFSTIDSGCENQPGYSISTQTGSAPDYWVPRTSSKPPNAKMLYSGVIGTVATAGNNQDSHYYSFTQGDKPAGWSGAGAGSQLAWVFTSSADAGPGSHQLCEIYHASTTHPYYDIEAAGAGCLAGTTFWT